MKLSMWKGKLGAFYTQFSTLRSLTGTEATTLPDLPTTEITALTAAADDSIVNVIVKIGNAPSQQSTSISITDSEGTSRGVNLYDGWVRYAWEDNASYLLKGLFVGAAT